MPRLDLHIHTVHSTDGFCTVKEAVAAAMAKGLGGLAITDHNAVSAHREAKRFSKGGFIIIPGIEVTSYFGRVFTGHIIGLGVRDLIPKGLPPVEVVERIKEQGGVAIAAHPFTVPRNPGLVYEAEFDAIEVLNSRAVFPSNPLARRFARAHRIPQVAGSDAHRLDEVGLAYTDINCEPELDSILKKIERGETSVGGRTLPLPSRLWRGLQKLLPRRRYDRYRGGRRA